MTTGRNWLSVFMGMLIGSVTGVLVLACVDEGFSLAKTAGFLAIELVAMVIAWHQFAQMDARAQRRRDGDGNGNV